MKDDQINQKIKSSIKCVQNLNWAWQYWNEEKAEWK